MAKFSLFSGSAQLAEILANQKQILSNQAVILSKLQILSAQGTTEMADLSALQTEVTNNTTVEQSAITLINGLAAQITAAGTDPVALGALVTQLQTNDAALAQAVAANTAAGSPTTT
jgi:hypothetical protein